MPDVEVAKKRLDEDEENVPAGRETISGDEKRAVQKTSESDGRILRKETALSGEDELGGSRE